MKRKNKSQIKRELTKKELLEMLLNKEKEDLDKMDEMVDLLISKNITMNINSEANEERTFGERMSDRVAKFAGSWGFIFTFAIALILWILANVYFISRPFDKYPFVFLNLILGCVTALQSPIIMMSQNRQEKKDRLRSENDYKIDLKAEFILEGIYNKLIELQNTQDKIKVKIEKLEKDSNIN